jgi:DNA-directed RNA polymerase omega subunit
VRPFPIEELVDRVGSRFTVVVAAAKRAKQIKDGAPPLVNLPTRNALTIALHEIAAGLIQIGDAPPEAEEASLAVLGGEEIADLAAPEVVESLISRGTKDDDEDGGEGGDDDYDSDLDEELADDLDEDAEDEDEDEDEEEDEDDEDDEEDEEEDDVEEDVAEWEEAEE